MTRPRSELVSPDETPYYHCICRCVRRAYLFGEDQLTGQNYSHRKQWVLDRLRQLQSVFTIDLCAYAVMANHYHLVVHVDTQAALALDETAVVSRWRKLFRLPVLVERYVAGSNGSDAEQVAAKGIIALWRERLADLSWYMRCLNEHIARKANLEDECTGRFWEGRFHSQAILDDAGLLTCMTYVDLNPLRAGIVKQPEASADVSLHQRLQQYKAGSASTSTSKKATSQPHLLPFVRDLTEDKRKGIPFALGDYLAMIDWVGRVQCEEQQGYIHSGVPPLLDRMGLDANKFLTAVKPHQLSHGTVIGHASARIAYARLHHRRCVIGPVIST
ncbi:transposase [Oceanisphaera sediminis]|uniref:Transposase n=1 Tax=Oceanisphaera sediminis TaxID=981381 RepID=A0ABP7DL25_9GAMM